MLHVYTTRVEDQFGRTLPKEEKLTNNVKQVNKEEM